MNITNRQLGPKKHKLRIDKQETQNNPLCISANKKHEVVIDSRVARPGRGHPVWRGVRHSTLKVNNSITTTRRATTTTTTPTTTATTTTIAKNNNNRNLKRKIPIGAHTNPCRTCQTPSSCPEHTPRRMSTTSLK